MKINNKQVTNISLAGKIVVQIKDVLSGQILYKKEDEQKDYFSISPIDGGPAVLTITVPRSGGTYLETIEYSEDQKTWNTKTLVKGANTIEFNDKLFLRSSIGHLGKSIYASSHRINVDVPFNAAGNIMSLLYGQDFENKTTFEEDFPFSFLFYQSNIVNANELILPATELTNSAYEGMFQKCSSLVTAPEIISATELTEYCYRFMFQDCSALTTVPTLPAMEMQNYCYDSMFKGCSSLTAAPTLPATILADHCYDNMFEDCSSLNTVPEILPATTLANYCYDSMFSGCSSLVTAPTLPATELTSGCYDRMFRECSSLTTAPALPATELASYCYANMFYNCSSLTKAPILPATILANECYFGMFSGCTSLNFIKADFIEINSSATINWVQNVAPTGTFVKNPDATWEDIYGPGLIPTGWKVEVPFYIENISDATAQATFKKTNSAPYLTMSYSTDKGQTWNPIMITNDYTFDIPAHSKIYLDTAVLENSLKATYDGSNYNYWTIDASTINTINVGGNLSYLTAHETNMLSGSRGYFYGLFYKSNVNSIGKLILDYDVLGEYTFQEFARQSKIKEAPKVLPATTLGENCYRSMFRGCSSLTTAPELPATTLAARCYYEMFRECSKLTTAPDLPATRLTQYCYSSMFYNCSKLNYIKADFLTTPNTVYLSTWVYGVAATGTFVKNPAATWVSYFGPAEIPTGWTVVTE